MSEIPAELLAAWFFAMGLCVGSFLNVCISRIPAQRSVVFPPSACPTCGSRIRWYDNIPLLSYLVLRGRCRRCHAWISPVYPLVELLGGAIFLAQFLREGLTVELARGSILLTCLVVLFFIDLRHMILPDIITYPSCLAGLAFAAAGLAPITVLDSLSGALGGAATLLFILGGYYLVRRRQGMGLGDVKMMLSVGAFLGLKGTYLALVAASLTGGVFSVGLLLLGKKFDYAIPFGTFLALGGAFSYFAGSGPLDWYLSLLQY